MESFLSGLIGVHAARLVALELEEDLEIASILLLVAVNALVNWMTCRSAILTIVVSSW